MKRPKHGEIDIETAREFAKQYSPKLLKAVLDTQEGKKTPKGKKQSNQKQSTVTDSIYEELQQPGFALTEARRQLSELVLEPIPKLRWTKELPAYNKARLSAENAMGRIWAGTRAAKAGREGDPWLDVCLYEMRAGLVQSNDPAILRYVQHAQKIGKGQWFVERLSAAFKNAGKRVPNAPEFSPLRAKLARLWVGRGLWLMSDRLIAGCAHVSREAIRKAVSELKLVKHIQAVQGTPVVKGVDDQGRFIFAKGYPLKS
jgi:hypothetical protein